MEKVIKIVKFEVENMRSNTRVSENSFACQNCMALDKVGGWLDGRVGLSIAYSNQKMESGNMRPSQNRFESTCNTYQK